MQHESKNTSESSAETTQHSRRKFLTRATAGVVIASLPAKSVWASSGGIAQSIVASGHGSDFTQGVRINVKSHGFFKNNPISFDGKSSHTIQFSTVFGGKPIKGAALSASTDTDFLTVLKAKGNTEFAGPSNVNKHMIAIYLSAVMDQKNLMPKVYYPLWKKFGSPEAFAQHIYTRALVYPDKVGVELSNIIACFDNNKSAACSALGVSPP